MLGSLCNLRCQCILAEGQHRAEPLAPDARLAGMGFSYPSVAFERVALQPIFPDQPCARLMSREIAGVTRDQSLPIRPRQVHLAQVQPGRGAIVEELRRQMAGTFGAVIFRYGFARALGRLQRHR